ncbi:MAG: TIM barrel protein, partial [Oscillospiraceae bacterium]|nr:TIM barrel protein [Oscillospiraceae bacterium]
LKDKVAHVHLKDRSRDASRFNGENGKPDLSGEMMYPCELGGGYIGIGELVKRLIKDGYSGSFSIEHFGALNQLEYARKSVEYIRNLM